MFYYIFRRYGRRLFRMGSLPGVLVTLTRILLWGEYREKNGRSGAAGLPDAAGVITGLAETINFLVTDKPVPAIIYIFDIYIFLLLWDSSSNALYLSLHLCNKLNVPI